VLKQFQGSSTPRPMMQSSDDEIMQACPVEKSTFEEESKD
jgi:ABC-type phosphate transport system substrate-binding protein